MIQWLDRKLSAGLYRGPISRLVAWCDRSLSLNKLYKSYVRKRLCVPEGTKSPAWVSELYQCLSLGLAVVLLVVARFAPRWLSYTVATVALYRPLEILLFAVRWVFVHTDPLHSYKRSLAGFIINIAEVVVFYAAAYLGYGFVNDPPLISTALYSSLRTTVTIGPTSTAEPPGSWLAGTLIMTQIVVSYFLTIVVIANVVGTLRKKEVVEAKPAA